MSIDHVSFVEAGEVFFGDSSVIFVVVVKFGEFEIFIALMFFPFVGDFGSSPEPDSIDVVVSFDSVNTKNAETVFSEMVDVSEITVFQVGSEVADFSFT